MPDRLTELFKAQVRKHLPSEARREVRWWLDARRDAVAHRNGLLSGWTVLWGVGGRVELVPIEVAGAGPGEVTLECHYTVVSPGTERAQFLRLPNAQVALPYRPGYSASGVVRAVGRGVTHVAPGDLVAAIGVSHASVATVPARSVFRVPDGVDLAEAATIRLGIIGALGPRLGRVGPGMAVCVVGAGPIGLLAQRLASAEGAGPVTVVAISRRREAASLAGGAAEFVLASERDRVAALAAPVVIEATGDPDAAAVAVAAAGEGARVVLLGSSRGTARELPIQTIRERRLTLVGAHVMTLREEEELTGEDPEPAIGAAYLAALAARKLSVADFVATRIDPGEASVFYRDLAGTGDVLGAAFDWTLLPDDQRTGRGRLTRLPDVGSQGVHEDRPAASGRRRAATADGVEADPFAGATGHLRLGLLGGGDIAVKNAAGIAAAPNTELVAVFDPVPSLGEDVVRTYGGEALASAEEVFDRDDVDAVFICVPHHLHAPLAMQAIAAGKHVIVEKPPANDLAAAVAMTRAAQRAGVTLSVCFPHRYDPNVVLAKRLIEDGALGELGGALVSFLSDKPASYWLGGFSGRATSDWRSSREKAGGGVLIMNLSHYIDLVRHLGGVEPESLLAEVAAVDDETEVEDTVSVAVRYANGALGTVFGCSSARGIAGATELRLWGRDGQITVESSPRLYTLRTIDGFRASRWQTFGELAPTQIRAAYVSRFASAISEGREPDVTAEDGLAAQAFIEAAYRSADTGGRVRPADLLREAGEA